MLGLGVAAALLATLRPVVHWGPPSELDLFAAADRLANIILFIPFGAGLGLLGARGWLALAAGVAFSTGIEITQLWIPGRYSNPWDVATNGLGAWVGFWVPRALFARPGGWTGTLGVAAVLGLLGGQAWLAEPAVIGGPYAVRFRPETRVGRWPGYVDEARISGEHVWAGRRTDPLPGSVGEGAPLELDLRVPGAQERSFVVFEIIGDEGRTVIQVRAYRGELQVRFGDQGVRLGFGQTQLKLSGTLSPEAFHRLRLRAAHDGFCVTIDGEKRCGLGPTVAQGWARIHQLQSRPQWLMVLLDGLWMLGLGGLLGWWAPSGRFAVGAVASVLTVGVYLVANSGLAPPTVGQFGLGLLGVLGVMLGRRWPPGRPLRAWRAG